MDLAPQNQVWNAMLQGVELGQEECVVREAGKVIGFLNRLLLILAKD